MNSWNQMPLIRLLLPFLAGILSAIYCPFESNLLIKVLILIFLLLSCLQFLPLLNVSYKNSWIFGIASFCLFFGSGYQLCKFNNDILSSDHYSNYLNGPVYISGYIAESPVLRTATTKAVVEVENVCVANQLYSVKGKAMIYFKSDPLKPKLNYGDRVLARVDLKAIAPPQNPHEFNYKHFLAFHNIYYQGFVAGNNWSLIGKEAGNPVTSISIKIREGMLAVFKENDISGEEYAVGAALLLGYEDELDQNIISAYSSTGALHVLSVSGLHVAIVFIVFNWLLFFLDKIKHGKAIKAAILILLLWFYATITGLSPSVLRSATMFSFIIIGKAFDRYTNIYNTLAASAFLLLVIDPFIIMEVGFQLSYLAVVGIVYLQPLIYNKLSFDNWFMDQIWKITAVSIAAQVATFPLGLHYFHQFPNYFLLSNLIVIPVSTIIIYIGIGLFISAKIFLAGYIAILFHWSVWILNFSVKWIEKLPFSLTDGISISVFETWLLYAIILLFLAYQLKPVFKYAAYTLLLLIFLLVFQVIEQNNQLHQKKMVIYNIKGQRAIDLIVSKKSYFIADDRLLNDRSKMQFHIKHNWWELGLSEYYQLGLDSAVNYVKRNDRIINFFQKKIILSCTGSSTIHAGPGKVLDVDYLIIGSAVNRSINELQSQYKAKQIIFDSSCSKKQLALMKKECEKLNLNYYSVTDNGALEIDI